MTRTMFAAGLLALSGVAATAGETVLNFRLVTRTVDEGTVITHPVIHDASLQINPAAGVAVFEDGRIANKRFVNSNVVEAGGAVGRFTGVSTYTFENGDALNLRYVGQWDATSISGTYEVISGAGAYEGATGTGSIHGLPNSWPDATLWQGSLEITTPD